MEVQFCWRPENSFLVPCLSSFTLSSLLRKEILLLPKHLQGFPGGTVVKKKKKNPPAYAGNTRGSGSIPGLGRSPGVGNGNLLQYFCLENFMDRGAWQAPRGLEELDTAECTAFTNEPDS